jgi:hypothetical protein
VNALVVLLATKPHGVILYGHKRENRNHHMVPSLVYSLLERSVSTTTRSDHAYATTFGEHESKSDNLKISKQM